MCVVMKAGSANFGKGIFPVDEATFIVFRAEIAETIAKIRKIKTNQRLIEWAWERMLYSILRQ